MFRNLSLRYRLILVVMPLIAIFMVFNYYKIIAHEREILTEETHQRAVAIVRVLAASSAQAIASLNTHDLELAVDQVKALKDVRDVAIVNKNGAIEASPDIAQVGRTTPDPLIGSVLRGGPHDEPTVATNDSDGTFQVVAPIVINGRVEGAVALTLSLQTLRAAIGQSSTYVLELTAVLLVGAVLFMFAVAHWFTGPILRLARVARAIAAGDIERRADVRGGDEIGVLGEAFNEMASRLRGMMENEKREHEDLQRRVSELLERTERVSSGDLEVTAPESPDEMGRLAAGFNDMVRNLRHHTKIQQATLFELEESSRALSEANRQLKELDRLKSEFLNTVSHELRTPLTSIKAFSEILLDSQGDDPETLKEFLGIINQESDRLTRLINNLLDLSRIEAGRMQWDMEPLELREIAETCANTARALADKKGLTLEVAVPEGLMVVGDRDKLIQVVTNLLSNAVKFTPSGGKVRLAASRRGETVDIKVADTGLGIAPEYHDRVFEKFQQVDTSSTREVKGSGLGLPIVRSIVEAHGGTVSLESEPGKGSTFTVSLPAPDVDDSYVPEPEPEPRKEEPRPPVVTPREAAAAVIGATRPVEGSGRTILVVDDEMNIIRVMRHILEAEGYTVLEALSGAEALRRAKADRPDLILLDVLLPDIDGFEVLERLRGEPSSADIPVVILSILEAKEESFRLGAQDYCNKPIDRARLLETVQGLLGDPTQEVRILAVDDDPHILTAITQMLSSRGYRVSGAKDGLEALVRARDELPHLIVLDLYMPEMDGFEVIRRLRGWEETAHIPILVLTASDVALDEARAMKLGAERYMSKPFSEQQLSEVVHEALSRAMGPASDEPQPRPRTEV
jgi:signal transduction histidine kinase/DNA-binding response OmpR family regulator